jgi:hypothetical protein
VDAPFDQTANVSVAIVEQMTAMSSAASKQMAVRGEQMDTLNTVIQEHMAAITRISEVGEGLIHVLWQLVDSKDTDGRDNDEP